MLSQKQASTIGENWVNAWNFDSLEQYQQLYDEQAIEISTIASRMIVESYGCISGKKSLLYYWEIIRTKFPNYKYKLQAITHYKNDIIVNFTFLALNSTGIAKISLNECNKICKVVISHV